MWLTSGAALVKERYRKLDGEIKRLVKRIKQREKERLVRNLTYGLQTKLPRIGQPRVGAPNEPSPRKKIQVQPQSFTKHMETPQAERRSPQISAFKIDDTWRLLVKQAIIQAPRNKATGEDEIFAEALQIDQAVSNQIICLLCEKRISLKYLLKHWSTAKVVLKYKNRDRAFSTSYRPIALLSHVRKSIESAVARAIREKYTFGEA